MLLLQLECGNVIPRDRVEMGEANDELCRLATGCETPHRGHRGRLHGLRGIIDQQDGIDGLETPRDRRRQTRRRIGRVPEAFHVEQYDRRWMICPAWRKRAGAANAIHERCQQCPEIWRVVARKARDDFQKRLPILRLVGPRSRPTLLCLFEFAGPQQLKAPLDLVYELVRDRLEPLIVTQPVVERFLK